MRYRVGKEKIAETSIMHIVVVIRVTPPAQSARRVRVLPERRFKEVWRIYPGIIIINTMEIRMDYRSSNSNMATRRYIRTYSSVILQRRVSTSDAREGIAPSNVSKELLIQIRWHRQDPLEPTRVFRSMWMYTKSVTSAVRTP
jgi:hypothetical protein